MIKPKKLVSKKDLEDIKTKKENELIDIINEYLKSFALSLLSGKTINFDLEKFGCNKSSAEFIISTLKKSEDFMITQNPENIFLLSIKMK